MLRQLAHTQMRPQSADMVQHNSLLGLQHAEWSRAKCKGIRASSSEDVREQSPLALYVALQALDLINMNSIP